MAEDDKTYLSIEEVAGRLGISPFEVVTLIEAEVLDGHETDHTWLVTEESLRVHEDLPPALCRDSCEGRPFCRSGESREA